MYLDRIKKHIPFITAINAALIMINLCVYGQSVSYIPTTEDIANPERGLFQYDDDRRGEMEPLVEADLIAKRKKNQTVIYRHYTLVKFQTSPLDAQYLAFLKHDAVLARSAGVKMIVRFAYEEQFEKCKPNHTGASKDRVAKHLDQLADYFQSNSDVIVLVEAGFIGTYGEWYYGNSDFGFCGTPNYAARADIVWKLLEVLPPSRMIALRAAYYKRAVIEEWVKDGRPSFTIRAFSKRIGYYNDGFLADETDIGTFQDSKDRMMTAQDTVTMPMVGETSINSLNPNFNPYAVWEKAKEALKTYHWSLISGTDDAFIFTKGYICSKGKQWFQWTDETKCDNKTLIDRWTDNQRNEFRKNLGYRFVLVNGIYPQKAKAGQEIEITLNLKNEGWASPVNRRPVSLLLRNSATKEEAQLELKDIDARNWLPQTTTSIRAKVTLPTLGPDFPPARYDLFLYLPDAILNAKYCSAKKCNSADYAIKLANKDMWDLSEGRFSGYNSLSYWLIID